MKKNFFIVFIIVLYSHGLLNSLNIPAVIVDGLLMLIPTIIIITSKRKIRLAPGCQFVIFYVLWAIIAGLFHQENMSRPLLFSRYIVNGYLVLLAIYNTYFNEKEIKQINKAIFIMFFIQIFASLYEIFFIGRTEAMVGLMMSGGGGPATTFPMFAFTFLFAFYLFTQKLRYLIAGFSFLIVGYASGKLGVYFLVPIIAILSIIYYYKYYNKLLFSIQFTKPLIAILLFIGIIGIILPSADTRIEKLNLHNLSIIERIESFMQFSYFATIKSIDSQYTGSRIGTSLRVIEETFSRPPKVFFLGQGYKAYDSIGHSFGKGAYEKYGIVYGITGWTYDALVYGWLMMFFHVGFFLSLHKKLTKIRKRYFFKYPWNIYLFATIISFFVFYLNYFFYNTNYTVGGWMIYIHMYFIGLFLAPQYRTLFMVKNNSKN